MPDITPDDLPLSFRTVKFIQSAERRFTLTGMILSILSLSKESQAYVISPKVRDQTNRFFTYLTKSCASKTQINLRAAWLVTYGQCVQIDLLSMLHRYDKLDSSCLPKAESQLDDNVIRLVEMVVFYQVTSSYSFLSELEVTKVLNSIIDRSHLVKDKDRDIWYSRIIEKIEATVKRLTFIINLRLTGQEQDQRLLEDLHLINQALNHYALKRDTWM